MAGTPSTGSSPAGLAASTTAHASPAEGSQSYLPGLTPQQRAQKTWKAKHPDKVRLYRSLYGARCRAREKGIPFALTMGDLPPIPEVCPVLGIPILEQGTGPGTPSLDRIVPALGYVPGNVRFISWRANTLKSDATAAELWLVHQDALRIEEEYGRA